MEHTRAECTIQKPIALRYTDSHSLLSRPGDPQALYHMRRGSRCIHRCVSIYYTWMPLAKGKKNGGHKHQGMQLSPNSAQ